MRDLIDRQELLISIAREYNRHRTGDGLKLAWIEKAIWDVPSVKDDEEDEDDGK